MRLNHPQMSDRRVKLQEGDWVRITRTGREAILENFPDQFDELIQPCYLGSSLGEFRVKRVLWDGGACRWFVDVEVMGQLFTLYLSDIRRVIQ